MNVDKSPLLTVAIPTYNRSDSLEKIICQLSREKNQSFRILISDDNSSDNTTAMVKKYQKSMPNLFYVKNETNLGYSGNVCRIYELVKTRYLWFLSDDETVLPGAVDKIEEALVKYEPVVAVFNHIWIDPYGRKLVAGVSKDIIYDDINKLTDYQPLMRTVFLSTLVVEKRSPVDIIKQTDYKNNIFFQITLSLFLLSDKFKFCVVASPIVNRNTCYESGEFFKFYLTDNLKAISIIDHKFDNKKFISWSKSHIFTALQVYLSQKLGLFKYKGQPTKETVKTIIKYYGASSIFVFFFPILYYLIPTFLIKFLYAVQLFRIYGYKKGLEIYHKNLNRAIKNKRKTGFANYR